MDWRVLLFTAAVSLITAVGVGLVPALQASRVDLGAAMSQGGARGTLGAGSSRIRSGLVVAQIALSFMLAINAGLLLRSFVALTDTPLGFRTEGVLVAYASAPARGSIFDKSGLDDYLRVGQRFDELFARLRQIPGVTSAAGAMGLPTGTYDSNGSYAIEGKQTFGGDFRRLPSAGFRLASPGLLPDDGRSPSCGAGSSTTATSTIARSWPSSANRWRGRASGPTIRSGIASSAASIPTSG